MNDQRGRSEQPGAGQWTEEMLQGSEANFRTLFDSMDEMIIVGNLEGKIIYTNPAMTRKLGYSPAEFRKMHVLEVHPSDKRLEAEAIFAAMFRDERDVCPLPLQRKDGSLVPVETRVWLGRWNGADCICGLSRDLSGEQEALQKFDRLFNGNPAPMAVSNLPERVFTDVNESFLKTLGYSREEVLGKTSEELGLAVDPQMQQEMAKQLQANGHLADCQLMVRCKDGRILDGLFSGEIIESQGRQYFLTVMIDQTERKQTKEELQSERDFAMQVINAMGQGLTVTDKEGRFEYVNPAYARLFGYTSADLIGKQPQDVTAPEDLEVLEQQHAERQTGKSGAYDTRLLRVDGSLAHVLITAVPRTREGQYSGAIAVITDLTERKRLEEELRRAKECLEAANRGLEQALLREQLLARTDSLTGLLNHRRFFEIAEREFNAAVRYQHPLTILMFDVDGFKQVNDTKGHVIGDKVLAWVALTVAAQIREIDVLARYGGDEFVILLPQTNAEQALPIAERIGESIAAVRLEADTGSLGVTLSIGIAQMWRESADENVERIVQRADKALYEAKAQGRNCVVTYSASIL